MEKIRLCEILAENKLTFFNSKMERLFPFVVSLLHILYNATGRKYFLTKEFQKLIILFYSMNIVSSSLLNNVVQRGIRFSSYCPKMEYCTGGAHVMCMYYNPSTVMGPNCGQGQNITVTPELAELLLGIVNEIRGTVARGEETGENGVRLPKAYGMVRLRWDKELATFAQIWANQCIVQHDACRATKHFPNPAQLVSLVRFTYPDWRLIGDNSSLLNKNEGLTMSKLKHTITTTMKISYVQKNQVTREMIERFPDLTKMPHLASIRVFMTMIHTGSTHMGCGISAYADYYGKNSQSVIVNNVQIVCNFSAQPKPGSSVFAVQRAPGTSERCGCPSDTLEDEDCLCVPRRYRDPNEEIRSCSKFDVGCTSSGILPIITNNDSPVILYHPILGNESFFRRSAIHSNYKPRGNNFFGGQLRSQILKLSKVKLPKSNDKLNKQIGFKTRVNDVKNRYFDKQFAVLGQRYRSGGSLVRENAHVLPNMNLLPSRRNSIFTRVSNFKLPLQSQHVDHSVFQTNFPVKTRSTIKKDVKPRKDFSSLQDILTAYLKNKHGNNSRSHPVDHLINAIDTNTPKFGIAGFNTNIAKKHFEIKNSYEDTDNKLLTLLDNLEEEVKHIELNGDVKEMVDARIRKIYGNVVGEHKLFKTNTRVVDDLIKNVEKKTEKKVIPLQAHTGINVPEVEFALPPRRHQNSMNRYDNTIQDQYRDKQRIIVRNDRESYGSLQYRSNNRRRYKEDYSNKNDFLSDDDDLLGAERRRYYQNKLDNIERKLKNIRGYKRGDPKPNKGYLFRPVMKGHPTVDSSRKNNRAKSFFVPDRAKYLHGF